MQPLLQPRRAGPSPVSLAVAAGRGGAGSGRGGAAPPWAGRAGPGRARKDAREQPPPPPGSSPIAGVAFVAPGMSAGRCRPRSTWGRGAGWGRLSGAARAGAGAGAVVSAWACAALTWRAGGRAGSRFPPGRIPRRSGGPQSCAYWDFNPGIAFGFFFLMPDWIRMEGPVRIGFLSALYPGPTPFPPLLIAGSQIQAATWHSKRGGLFISV